MVFCLVVGVFSANAAYNLTMDAMDKDGTVATAFTTGSDLNLNINLDAGSAGVAACAFTLEWSPADALTPPTTDANGVSTGITSIFPFKTIVGGTSNDTHRENSLVAGKIYFAGAEITDKGGSKVHPYDVTLFTAKFTVKATSGNVTFTLKQTELLNPEAGWGVNGVAEAVPIIVGAMPNDATQATWDATWIDGFGGDLKDDFPVRLASFATNPTLIVGIGTSDYYTWINANYPQIATSTASGPMDDYDNDGFTNDQERLNNTDPTADTADPIVAKVDVTNPATWTAMGTGYNALTDFRVANLDVDGNGKAELGADGVMVMRYMFGYRGADLISGAINTDYCNRCDAPEIEAYIQQLFPN